MGKSLHRENRSIRETGGTSGKEKKKRYLNLADMYATSALLMRSFRYGTGEITWKYSCGSTCDENLVKKNCMFYRKSDHLSIIGMVERRECIHISAL